MPLFTQVLPSSDNNHIDKIGSHSSFKFHTNGLEVVGEPTFEEWADCGKTLYKFNESMHFLIGDWLSFGESHWGDTYRQVAEQTGFDVQTLRNDKWVAGRVPLESRREALSFTHHREVASANISAEEQDELLSYAEDNKLSTREFHKVIAQQTMQQKPKTEKPVHISSPASQDAEQIMSHANMLILWLNDLDVTLLPKDQRKQLRNTLIALERRIDAVLLTDDDDE